MLVIAITVFKCGGGLVCHKSRFQGWLLQLRMTFISEGARENWNSNTRALAKSLTPLTASEHLIILESELLDKSPLLHHD